MFSFCPLANNEFNCGDKEGLFISLQKPPKTCRPLIESVKKYKLQWNPGIHLKGASKE